MERWQAKDTCALWCASGECFPTASPQPLGHSQLLATPLWASPGRGGTRTGTSVGTRVGLSVISNTLSPKASIKPGQESPPGPLAIPSSSLRCSLFQLPVHGLNSHPYGVIFCPSLDAALSLVAPCSKGEGLSFCQTLYDPFQGSNRLVFFLSSKQKWKHRQNAIWLITQNKTSFSEIWFVD